MVFRTWIRWGPQELVSPEYLLITLGIARMLFCSDRLGPPKCLVQYFLKCTHLTDNLIDNHDTHNQGWALGEERGGRSPWHAKFSFSVDHAWLPESPTAPYGTGPVKTLPLLPPPQAANLSWGCVGSKAKWGSGLCLSVCLSLERVSVTAWGISNSGAPASWAKEFVSWGILVLTAMMLHIIHLAK